tara:strand:+ start:1081 stop:1542 length:462 start_codon:yes stop_codon:yes gene_type:complete
MADLVTQITESVVLNGAARGSTNSMTTTGIGDVLERIVTSFASTTTIIASFGAQPHTSPSAIDLDRTRYIRVTNLDDVTTVTLSIIGTSTFSVLLKPLESFIINGAEAVMSGSVTPTPNLTLVNIKSISVVNADATLNARLELFVGIAEVPAT